MAARFRKPTSAAASCATRATSCSSTRTTRRSTSRCRRSRAARGAPRSTRHIPRASRPPRRCFPARPTPCRDVPSRSCANPSRAAHEAGPRHAVRRAICRRRRALSPVGARTWGYDGVRPFAPDASYGTPEDFKRFVVEAHARGLMILLDVVYNHFGPEGNALARYAPQFFDARHKTPWGAAINFDGPDARTVRDFFVHNALYWIEEFHLDGLRLDAVHAIADDSKTHIVLEIAQAIAAGPGSGRAVHLVLENDANQARFVDPGKAGAHATAQWNDDWHHAAHVLVTGEEDGYYADYAAQPARHLARALAEGF